MYAKQLQGAACLSDDDPWDQISFTVGIRLRVGKYPLHRQISATYLE